MRVLHVCSELFPLLKTGGLADVLGALPQAQIAAGADVRLLMPGFPALMQQIHPTSAVAEIDTFAGRVTLRYGSYNGVGVYLIDAPHLYDRPGSPYHDASQHEYADNYRRFGLLGWIACELACGLDALWRPEVVHGHDWHAGLASASGRTRLSGTFGVHRSQSGLSGAVFFPPYERAVFAIALSTAGGIRVLRANFLPKGRPLLL